MDGSRMFRVVEKIKVVKKELRILKMKGFGDVECNEIRARAELENIQQDLHDKPNDDVLS